jgi:hypothetical protein
MQPNWSSSSWQILDAVVTDAKKKRRRRPDTRGGAVGKKQRSKKLHDEEAKNDCADNDEVQRKIVGREREETCDCGYHVMNNTCIHLRVKVPNIYMYKRGRIYKEPYGEI